MLHFFRKYQKFFFLFTTVIIVTSFAFFGTYQAFAPGFKGGHIDERTYSEQMADFLNTEQWMGGRKIFETNILNDGVISKEFLETGMADIVAEKYAESLNPVFTEQFEKEKHYQPYTHPFQPPLTAESMWSMFAPDLSEKLQAFISGSGGFQERSALFLSQKQFPPAFLTQVLRYQELNNPQFPRDPRLAKEDVALFGYHSMKEWFGEPFVDSIVDIIIRSAERARKQGLRVSKEEVLSDLLYRCQETYNGLKQHLDLPVEDGYGFFHLFLSQTGMKEGTVLKIWEDITLFRRLMHEVGSAAFMDPLPLSQFYQYAYENCTIELFQMPKELRFQSLDDLEKFESYLAAVSDSYFSSGDIPENYAPISTIEKRAPELVGKRIELYFAQVSKEMLQAKVSAKDTLAWECDSTHWEELRDHFPVLEHKEGTAFEVLDALDAKTRKLVDTFARRKLVDAHPEWIQEAFTKAEMDEMTLFVTATSKSPYKGILDMQALTQALNSQDEITGYTQDQETFYRFLVKKRGEEKEILSFQEALKEEGLLEHLSSTLDGKTLVANFVQSLPSNQRESAYLMRFAKYLNRYKEETPSGDLMVQFPILKKHQTITRAEPSMVLLDEALTLNEGEFSQICSDPEDGAYVYRFIERRIERSFPMEKWMQTQEFLSKEVRCRYFEQLLTQI